MFKRIILYSVLIISAISLIIIVAGFINAMQFTIGNVNELNQTNLQDGKPPIVNKVTANSNTIRIFIMGDSIAKGTGDEKIKGIGGYVPELLKNQTPKDIIVENAGIDGYKSSDLLMQINSGKLDNAVEISDIIIISIGGNDIREIQNLKDIAKEEAFKDKQTVFLTSLKEVVKKIRSLNKEVMIAFVGIYDPFPVEGSSENARLVADWNYNEQLIVESEKRAVFIPTYELFKYNLDRFIANDKLHPNSTGYQTISFLITKAVENTLNR